MQTSNDSKPIVSAILQKKNKDGLKIFMQTRWKPHINSPYSGMLEIPAGGIDAYEDVYEALKREVKEECGLDVVKIINDFRGKTEEPAIGDKSFAFQPFICQQVLSTRNGLPWIGFVFLCEVEGEVKMQDTEARNPAWVSLDELEKMITTQSENIFLLQLPVLKFYLEWAKSQR